MNNRNSIEFISSKYSFGCERTYNRIFKDEYNTTPAKWRRNPCPLNILDRFNADFMFSAGEGLMFFRSITVLPAFSIAGIEYKLDLREDKNNRITAGYAADFFYNKRPEVINPVEKDIYVGFTAFTDNKQLFALYQPSVKISSNSIIAPYMKVRHIKPHKYGVFTYMGPHRPEEISLKKLEALLNYVSSTWMPTVEFNLTENFRIEFIDYSRCNKQYCECDIYFPIAAL
jgi:AraC family transcriptional regulator